MNILSVTGLVKRFGGLLATDHLDLDVEAGQVHAVIGPNGAGKTTLMNQLSGDITPTEGRILFEGKDITGQRPYQRALSGIARSFQISSVFNDFSVLENTLMAVQARSRHSFRFWTPVLQDGQLVEPARQAVERAGLGREMHTPVGQLAHGARRQLEIAMALAMQPKLLLLDEPMAGMSQQESQELVSLLRSLKGEYSILLVEHDMDAVFALADRITVVVYGRPVACGTPDEIRGNDEVKAAYLGDQEETV